MALIEEGCVSVTKIDKSGMGVGFVESGPIALPYVMPGDVVCYEKHHYRGKTDIILKSIESFSSDRANPLCPIFSICGGCSFQHFSKDKYLEFKSSIISTEFADQDIAMDENVLEDLISVEFGNRRRANLEAIKKKGNLYFGFHRFRSHQIINLDDCPALSHAARVILLPLKELLSDVLEDKEKASIFITDTKTGIDISLEIQDRKSLTENQRALVQEFGRKYDIARFRFRFRKTIDIICAHRLPVVEFGGFDVEVDSYCFLQATTKSDKILADYVLKFFANFSALDLKVADLFCGRGTYTIPLSAHYIVDGFESDQKALSALGNVVQTNGLNISLSHRDLFTHPLTFNELAKYTKIVINPPRVGAELQVRELSKSTVSEICYISCNPNSFTRDAKILIDAGYKLETLVPFDQFYYASHLEVIGYFVKCK